VAYEPVDLIGVVAFFLCLVSLGYIIIAVHSPAKDRNYLLFLYSVMLSLSLACFFYYGYDDLAAGGKGFRGGDEQMWFEAGQSTLLEIKSGRSLYDIMINGVYVDWTSPLHPAQTLETGRMGYPLLLAFMMGIGGNNLITVVVFNCFLGSLIPFIAYKIGTFLPMQFNGRRAALLVVFSPLIFYSSANLRDVHIAFLVALTVLISIRFIKERTSLRFLQIITLTLLIYLFRYISGLIMLLGLASLLMILTRLRHKYVISILLVTVIAIMASVGKPQILDVVTSATIGQLNQALANVGEEIGDMSSSITRTIAIRFIDSPLLLVFLPLPAIVLQLFSPPVRTAGDMWVLYWLNAVRFIFFLPYILSGIFYIISNINNKQLSVLMIIYLIAIIAYAPIAIFMGNRYMISMISIEAVFMGIGFCNVKQFNNWQRIWVVVAFSYTMWHWLYRVTSIS
jgi:hypothetical protein